jgi:DNA polymerase-3 subunit delta'
VSIRAGHAENLLRSFSRLGSSHAILIEGALGSGKSDFARRYAMAVLCRAEHGRPCFECLSCRKVLGGNHPDFHVFEGDKRPGGFHVETVREARACAFVLPNESERKVLLLKNCETMTQHGQNALLKVLEEPPPSAVFLLTARNRQELLPTILSRVNVIALEPEDNPEDPAHGQAEQFFGYITGGEEMRALAFLKKYEKDRAGLSEFMECLRAYLSDKMIKGGYRCGTANISRRELFKLCEIVEDGVAGARSNTGGLLLGCNLCARLCQALE